MTAGRRFQHLTQQFELLAQNLSDCQDAEERKEILKGMQIVIGELDQIILNDYLDVDAMRNGAAQQSAISMVDVA
jgi:hypothetical protein